MTARRVMTGVLYNFLDTYISRYSDYRGYWLHGQLPSSVEKWKFDLLGRTPESDTPVGEAWRLASRRFAEQLYKAGLTLDLVREAALEIVRIQGVVKGWQGDFMADGQMVRFSARSVVDTGRVYQNERTIFVAPHDPRKERRSSRSHA
jgi:hypothetical protein